MNIVKGADGQRLQCCCVIDVVENLKYPKIALECPVHPFSEI